LKKRFLIPLLLLAVLPFLLLDSRPAVDPSPMREADMDYLKSFLRRNDPRGLPPGALSRITLTEEEASRLLTQALHLRVQGAAAVDFVPDGLRLTVTLALPWRYLNLAIEASQEEGEMQVTGWRAGLVPVPAWLANLALRDAYEQLLEKPEILAMQQSIVGLRIGYGQADLRYRWHPRLVQDLGQQGARLLVAHEDRARLLHYWDTLAAITRPREMRGVHSISVLTAPMFAEAERRGGDTVAENRAAILAMAAYFSRTRIPRLLGEDDGTDGSAHPNPRHRSFLLGGRGDLAGHFVYSAAVQVTGGSALAHALGLTKEEQDSVRGSGFSFTDLAADRAGVAFAEAATASHASARRVQTAMAQADEAGFVPRLSDLPEYMPEAEFRARFGGAGTPAYQAMVQKIDARIAALPVLRAAR
jgi:hypothetical protein